MALFAGGKQMRESICDAWTAAGVSILGIFLSTPFAVFAAGLSVGCALSSYHFWDQQI